MRKLVAILATLGVLATSGLLLSWRLFSRFLSQPASAVRREVKVEIPEPSGPAALAALLHREGLVEREDWFLWYLEHFRKGLVVRGGEYAFMSSMSPVEILAVIEQGQVVTYPLIIRPGSRAREVVAQISELGLAQASELEALLRSRELMMRHQIPASTPEGFLYPDAYDLPKGLSADEILGKFLAAYRRAVDAEVLEAGRLRGLTEYQLVTLASIIELESERSDERSQFSAVYHNRLKKGMNLESEAALAYGLGKPIEALTDEDRRVPNDYNTFLNPGLPPTPIASPSAGSLRAAAQPAVTDALYVAPKEDSMHLFCVTEDCQTEALRRVGARRTRHFRRKSTP